MLGRKAMEKKKEKKRKKMLISISYILSYKLFYHYEFFCTTLNTPFNGYTRFPTVTTTDIEYHEFYLSTKKYLDN